MSHVKRLQTIFYSLALVVAKVNGEKQQQKNNKILQANKLTLI